MQNNMQNIQKILLWQLEKNINPFGICRILTSLYSAYLSCICTPHFAGVVSWCMLHIQHCSSLHMLRHSHTDWSDTRPGAWPEGARVIICWPPRIKAFKAQPQSESCFKTWNAAAATGILFNLKSPWLARSRFSAGESLLFGRSRHGPHKVQVTWTLTIWTRLSTRYGGPTPVTVTASRPTVRRSPDSDETEGDIRVINDSEVSSSIS